MSGTILIIIADNNFPPVQSKVHWNLLNMGVLLFHINPPSPPPLTHTHIQQRKKLHGIYGNICKIRISDVGRTSMLMNSGRMTFDFQMLIILFYWIINAIFDICIRLIDGRYVSALVQEHGILINHNLKMFVPSTNLLSLVALSNGIVTCMAVP